MPSFSDSIFLFILALLLFGPKRLPVLARELGKWVGEFRRASNEFKMQMEEELRASEQDERQKQIAAMEAAAPLPASIEEPSHPHLDPYVAESAESAEPVTSAAFPQDPAAALGTGDPARSEAEVGAAGQTDPSVKLGPSEPPPARHTNRNGDPEARPNPLPIATAGDLRMMPPATGLPTARSRSNGSASTDALHDFVHSIPEMSESEATHLNAPEGVAHGD